LLRTPYAPPRQTNPIRQWRGPPGLRSSGRSYSTPNEPISPPTHSKLTALRLHQTNPIPPAARRPPSSRTPQEIPNEPIPESPPRAARSRLHLSPNEPKSPITITKYITYQPNNPQTRSIGSPGSYSEIMCGIAGHITREPSPQADQPVKAMLAALARLERWLRRNDRSQPLAAAAEARNASPKSVS
jgi:hypothetical protein